MDKNDVQFTNTILLPPVLTIYGTTFGVIVQVNVVCRQPVRHYAAPLLGGIKTNAT